MTPTFRLPGSPNAFLVSVVVLTVALTAGCTADEPAAPATRDAAPQPVIHAPVRWAHQLTGVQAVGTSRARHSVMLYADSAGEVEAVHFTGGQKVQAGDLLLQLEADDERLAVDLAATNVADARRLLDRYRRTKDSGAVTPSSLDEAQTAVERAEILLARASVALRDRQVRAPFSGHIGLTTVDPGARINLDTPIATLDDRSLLLITFPLPELVFGQLRPGENIELSTWSQRSTRVTGTITAVDSRIDPDTRRFLVRARVDNSADLLRPGMSFRVVLELQGAAYPQVPEIALQWGGDGAYVWAVEDGRARRVPATVVQRGEGTILIDADLPEGTLVVVEGVQRMREGLPVRAVDQPQTMTDSHHDG